MNYLTTALRLTAILMSFANGMACWLGIAQRAEVAFLPTLAISVFGGLISAFVVATAICLVADAKEAKAS